MNLFNLLFQRSKPFLNSCSLPDSPSFFFCSIHQCPQNAFLSDYLFFIRGNKHMDQVWWIRGMGHRGHVVVSQKLAYGQRCVCNSIVVVVKPIAYRPQIRSLSPHNVRQPFQNFQVECPVNSLTRRHKLWVHNSSHVEKTNQRRFEIWLHLTSFFGSRGTSSLPLAWLLLCFEVITASPWTITSYELLKKVWIGLKHFFQFTACFHATILSFK